MTWLNGIIKSNEITDSLLSGADDIFKSSDKYFEFDDNTTGVDIEGYLFFPKQVNGDESFSHREFLRTKIMSGGEFVTRGQYVPKEFTFDTIIDIEPEKIDEYYAIFDMMENKVCTITSPYMGGMFKGEVNITVTNPESSPHVIECRVKIKEIPDIMARLKGDPVIQYPSINTISDVSVREKPTQQQTEQTQQATQQQESEEKVQRYDAPTSSDSNEF